MALTLPLLAALLGGSLITQVPLQVDPYRGGTNEEETSSEELELSPFAEEEEVEEEPDSPALTPPPTYNKRRLQRPAPRPGLPRSLHVDSFEPIDR